MRHNKKNQYIKWSMAGDDTWSMTAKVMKFFAKTTDVWQLKTYIYVILMRYTCSNLLKKKYDRKTKIKWNFTAKTLWKE